MIGFEVETIAGSLILWAGAVRGFSDCNGFFHGLPQGRLKGGAETIMLDEDLGPNSLSSGS
jgi:hypothetical protein